ncbi:glycosyltransferase [Calidifontibacillus erzurumensis]|uniref:glycosyltransferase n=1 Tax=Calidifontibacillus erzurumensis TaxID=2741433 RepID=UPI0035B4FF9B
MDNKYEELKEKKLHNEILRMEIDRLEHEIAEMERQNQLAKEKLQRLTDRYTSMKESFAWSILRKAKRMAKVSSQYLSGRRSWRLLLSSSLKRKKAKAKINKLKYRLYELGFIHKAIEDLQQIIEKSDDKYLKREAAWELALWHANQYSQDHAELCLQWLPIALKGEKDEEIIRRAAIIEAECLERIGKADKGMQIIKQALQKGAHADLYLAAANLETSVEKKVEWINRALTLYGLAPISIHSEKRPTLYDRLIAEGSHKGQSAADLPKVSIIIPVYNSGEMIRTTIESLLNQTWKNIEILVVDDASTDETVFIVEEYVKRDSRVHLIRSEINAGPYVARNRALTVATGEYITINDADDWSHPEKIEIQVKHLMEHPEVMANTSEQARATDGLKFYRRGKPGSYLFANMSSLMFRRQPVLEELGCWDEVRFGADGEFKRRLKLVFGDRAVVDLKTGPLSFQRQSSSSLTGNQVFGYHGYFMGARKEYFESYTYYHKTANTLKYEMNPKQRPFPVPEPMWPKREAKAFQKRHFDVIIASEFRLLGGTNMSNVEEIKAQKRMGLRTGLIQMYRYDFDSEKQINPKIRELIDGTQVQMLVYGENVSCDVLIIRHPPVLQEWQKYLPNVDARTVKVIINQPPKRDYSKNGKVLYNFKQCAKNVTHYFGKVGKWYPIGPLIRETLYNHHKKDLTSIKLASEDWVNIIDVDEWSRPSRPNRAGKIKIGRHSRSQYVKWPADRNELLTIYPDSDDYEIHVLGGADAPKKVLGQLPANWRVYEFGEVDPKEFLRGLDVFVYYTHPDWIESFGRVILEAMAAGVPVIIPPVYKNLFGEAAIYAEPQDVQKKIQQLMTDDDFYNEIVTKARAFVEVHFGYTKHAARIKHHLVDRNGCPFTYLQ